MRLVTLDHAGVTLTGELYAPPGASGLPIVLVMHTALGLGGHVRAVCERLVALGYAALATDMFGQDFGGDPAKAGPFFAELVREPERIRSRARAWFDLATGLPEADPGRIAAIGYCFGGQCVLELARSGAGLRAAVGFHGLLKTHAPAEPGAVQGEVAVWCGGQDPYAPVADIEALRAELAAAGASNQITVFANVEHGFTDRVSAALNRPGIAYDALADAVSWAGTVALLETVLRG
jgi:dienelactone hydrolase